MHNFETHLNRALVRGKIIPAALRASLHPRREEGVRPVCLLLELDVSGAFASLSCSFTTKNSVSG